MINSKQKKKIKRRLLLIFLFYPMKTIYLNILAFSTLLFSVFSITSKNPVISILFLITTFVLAACYLISIGITFIGISYIIVYIGAIAVLFLFVIMMINIRLTDILETGTQYTKTLPLALAIVSLFIYIFYLILPFFFDTVSLKSALLDIFLNLNSFILDSSSEALSLGSFIPSLNESGTEIITNIYNTVLADTIFTSFLQIEAIGFSLYIYDSSLLINCSLILLLAMFAAIIISRKN